MTKRKKAPQRGVPEFEGGFVGAEHVGDGEGTSIVIRGLGGARQAVFLPRGITRLGEDGFEVAHALQHTTMEIRRLNEALKESINDARALGFSWSSIGFCVGTTGEAARQRWGEVDE